MVTCGTDDDPQPVSITCALSPGEIRVSVVEETSGRVSSFQVDRTDLTTLLAEHLLACPLELEVLSGVRDIEGYRLAVFNALSAIARCAPVT